MGFLSDLNLSDVDDDPNSFPDGTYKGHLFECKVIEYKDTAKGKAVVFTYKIADGDHKGKTIDEWKSCNAFDEPGKKAWLKNRISSLGVPESKMDSLDPTDLVGTGVIFTKKSKGEYANVTFVKLDGGEPVASSAGVDVSSLL